LLCVIEYESGNFDRAEHLITKAIGLNPGDSSFYNNLSLVLMKQGRTEEAVTNCRKAVYLDPNNFRAFVNLGDYLSKLKRFDEAGGCYKKAISMKPDYAPAHRNLGDVFLGQGFLSEAISCYQKALAIKPDFAGAQNNLGNAFIKRGCLPEAIECFRKAVALRPDYHSAHSNLILTLNCLPESTQEEIYKESLQWANRHAEGFPADGPVHANSADKERRLKIGYLSPDFRSHSVACFFEPVLNTHNRHKVETFCYANVLWPDNVTERIRITVDHWCSIVNMNDTEVVEQVKRDGIDILVDLAGHTAKGRLLIFAGKPAPVQVTWLGYPNTTGLRTIDYRLTDATADPAGGTDRLHSEELIRLPGGFLCYQAEGEAPAVSELPCLQRGEITFGSFNNLTKVTPEVVKVWSGILQAIPGSRLVLKYKQLADTETKRRYLEMFERHGISPERIKLFGWLPDKEDHLGFYRKIDIGLDPFPYNGTTTTCEALWMGVPVVTLRGDRHAGRVGASIMNHIDLEELVADSIDGYMELAQSLAGDRDLLVEMRSGLREQMSGSELMDKKLFTRTLEDTYRRMWYKWCDQKK